MQEKLGGQWMDWEQLVSDIRSGVTEACQIGMADLYRLVNTGIRYYVVGQLGPQELEDKVHDTFIIVVNAILKGDLRQPERLMGFVRTVVRRQVSAYISQKPLYAGHEQLTSHHSSIIDHKDNPEVEMERIERQEHIQQSLYALRPIDRLILVRCYLEERTKEEICDEFGLTAHQFKLLKHRATKKLRKRT